jgi:hypothetical protein
MALASNCAHCPKSMRFGSRAMEPDRLTKVSLLLQVRNEHLLLVAPHDRRAFFHIPSDCAMECRPQNLPFSIFSLFIDLQLMKYSIKLSTSGRGLYLLPRFTSENTSRELTRSIST